jgi:hypothetical protein
MTWLNEQNAVYGYGVCCGDPTPAEYRLGDKDLRIEAGLKW